MRASTTTRTTRRPCALGAALGLALALAARPAGAHITLDAPPVRDPSMKTAPCGGLLPFSSSPMTFAPGAPVMVRWHETVPHPGYFRVALSMDGTTFPADPPDPPPAAVFPVLAIVPKVDGTTSYSAAVTLPTTPCARCTLQVIQYMQQHAPPPYYYQCADITIAAGGSDDAGSPPATGGSSGGCCAVAGAGGASEGALAAAALLAAALVRRRARTTLGRR